MSVHIYAIRHSHIYANKCAEDETPICVGRSPGGQERRIAPSPLYGLLNTGQLEYATSHDCEQKGPALRAGDGEASTPCTASPAV